MLPTQNFKNHTQLVPGFHFVTLPLILILIIGSIVNLVHTASDNLLASVLLLTMSCTLLLVSFFARTFALKAQDRAIRAEENFRHFIATGKPLDKEIKMSQIVALRFAGDDEFVSLAQKSISEKLSSKEIKMAIQNWKSDFNRV